MAIRNIKFLITGVVPLLMSNPQTVDPFNKLGQKIKTLNSKGAKRTDQDYREIADLDMEAKVYFDDTLGVYVPARWVTTAVAVTYYGLTKTGKSKVRGALFPAVEKLKLHYAGMNKVKGREDVTKNPDFRCRKILAQSGKRVAKTIPIFHDWSFEAELEYDDKVINTSDLKRVVEHCCRYGGWGDFRPTYGRASVEFIDAISKAA